MILKIFKWIGIALISFLLLLALSYGIFHLWEYMSGTKYVNFLTENNESRSLDEKFDFQIMDQDVSDAKLILVGEIHGFKEPQLFDIDFFKYLHQKHGVKIYLAELDIVQSYLLNHFLDNPDEELLKTILNKWVVAQGRNNKTYFEKYLELQKYYKSLPEQDRFQFVGIDKIQDWSLISGLIAEWAKQEALKIKNRNDIEKLSHLVDSIIPAFSHSPDSMKLLNLIQKNINYSLDKTPREETMFLNFSEFYNTTKDQYSKFYGYFGLFHVMQYRINGNHPFASMVRQSDLDIADQILSINFVMNDSYMVMPSKQLPEFIRDKSIYTKLPVSADNMLIMYMIGIKDFKRITPGYHKSIFKMNATNSPYGNSYRLNRNIQILPVTDLFELDDSGKPYVQYTVFIRNSDWAEPFEK